MNPRPPRRPPAVLSLLLSLLLRATAAAADVYDVVEYGAAGDGTTDDTAAIAAALAAAARSGREGGSPRVLFPGPGRTYLTGPFNVTSDRTTLVIDGTVLAATGTNSAFGAERIRDGTWPQLPPLPSYQSSEDMGNSRLQHQALIYARDVRDLRITGTGVVDGGGPWWWDRFDAMDRDSVPAGRPNLIQAVNCTGLELDGLTLRDAAFWTVHPAYCTGVHVHHVTIRARMYAPNVDGIDPDSCRDVLIEDNDIGCGDDHIAIKAGRCGPGRNDCRLPEYRDGTKWRTENVTVRNNLFRIGMGIAVGSESSGSIRGVEIYDNVVGWCDAGHCEGKCCGWSPGLHIKTSPTRGGLIEGVIFRNNTVYNTTSFIFVEMGYQSSDPVPTDYPPTRLRNITFVNNRALGSAVGANFACAEGDACEGIRVINNTVLDAGGRNPWGCHFVRSFEVSGNSPPGLEECMQNSMNASLAIHDDGRDHVTAWK